MRALQRQQAYGLLLSVLTGLGVGQRAEDKPADVGLRPGVRADALLRQVAQTYESTRSFRDKGRVTSYAENGEDEDYWVDFKIAFIRPERFRFEWVTPGSLLFGNARHVVWTDGQAVKTWWQEVGELGHDRDLNLALAGATGVSRGSAHTIPAILLGDRVSGRKITDIVRPHVERTDKVGDRDVWVVIGLFAEFRIRVFIDKERLTILRIEEYKKEDRHLLDEVTTYAPELGAKIEDAELEKGWK